MMWLIIALLLITLALAVYQHEKGQSFPQNLGTALILIFWCMAIFYCLLIGTIQVVLWSIK